jgi:hypothetical protein
MSRTAKSALKLATGTGILRAPVNGRVAPIGSRGVLVGVRRKSRKEFADGDDPDVPAGDWFYARIRETKSMHGHGSPQVW